MKEKPPQGRDRIYAGRMRRVADFEFDAEVAAVFDDMIRRSVPGYTLLVPLIAQLAARHAGAGDRVYDLGCSSGAVTLALAQTLGPEVEIVAVDKAEAMVERCRRRVADHPGVEVRCQDLRQTRYRPAAMAVLNFTLQFLAPEDRAPLLRRLHAALTPGGVLVLAEKLRFEDPAEDARLRDWHHDFKRVQGYSELEIARKREALENVMRLDTEAVHLQRLAAAGFGATHRVFQCFNFAAYVALK